MHRHIYDRVVSPSSSCIKFLFIFLYVNVCEISTFSVLGFVVYQRVENVRAVGVLDIDFYLQAGRVRKLFGITWESKAA